ncbi:MAG: TerB family tellurite resistance protein [Planctomycetaceae bacterium]|nr:TerB family tellurite resistance protein [Planctomycetaceae bacterium]
MARSKKKSGGVLIGPIIVLVAIVALWKNEGRFDYYRAAKSTQAISTLATDHSEKLISYTEAMQPDLTMPGDYVETLVGYLTINRSAEIYAWDRDEDDEGHVSWSKEWMSSLESNSRNSDLSQQLSSKSFRPESYEVGELTIETEEIEFVDANQNIPVASLLLSEVAQSKQLTVQDNYLYLSKHQPSNLGDERINYRGIPVPPIATYFGMYSQSRGIAHHAVKRDGFIDQIIQDTGVLHHLVAGKRTVALKTIKSYLTRLKWVVRGVGFLGISIGFVILLSSAAGFIYHLPLVGRMVQWGVWAISFILGALISIMTITSSYLFHHPITLAGMLATGAILFYLSRNRAIASQHQIKQSLDQDLGHTVSEAELEELEFIELVQLALVNQTIDVDERKHLLKWAKKRGWDRDKVKEIVARAKRTIGDATDPAYTKDHLKNLIRLALADGDLSAYELRTITKAAKEVGFSRSDLKRIVKQIRQPAVT